MRGLPGGCEMPMGPNSETDLEAKRGRVPSPGNKAWQSRDTGMACLAWPEPWE